MYSCSTANKIQLYLARKETFLSLVKYAKVSLLASVQIHESMSGKLDLLLSKLIHNRHEIHAALSLADL